MMVGNGVVHAGWGAAAGQGVICDRDLVEKLLAAHGELTAATAAQVTELRAVLLRGDTADRSIPRSSLSNTILGRLARYRAPSPSDPEQVGRATKIRRLALVVRDYRAEIAANRDQLATLVNELVPGLTAHPGMGPLTAAKTILDSTGATQRDTGT
jgi:hypothetical protein